MTHIVYCNTEMIDRLLVNIKIHPDLVNEISSICVQFLTRSLLYLFCSEWKRKFQCDIKMLCCDAKVHVGHAGPYLYTCIRYDTGEYNTALIVGLVVGLGVPLILLIIVVAAVRITSRRRGKDRQVLDEDNDDVEMSPASDAPPDVER